MCTYQTRCTSIAPAIRHFLFTIGLTRPARKPWIETEKAWQIFLTSLSEPTLERELTLSELDSKSTGKIPELRCRSWLGSPNYRKSSTLKVHIGRPNCAILDHSMTALAE